MFTELTELTEHELLDIETASRRAGDSRYKTRSKLSRAAELNVLRQVEDSIDYSRTLDELRIKLRAEIARLEAKQ